jgi:hypothetical protein
MPNGSEWSPLVTRADLQAEVMAAARAATGPGTSAPPAATPVTPPRSAVARMLRAVRLPGDVSATLSRLAARTGITSTTPAAPPIEDRRQLLVTEAVLAGTIAYLAQRVPAILTAAGAAWQRILGFMDPLNQFDPTDTSAVLSPIGALQVYRQYFFELGSFLGPAVEHVWLSPGSSLELYEVHTRRTVEERQVELSFETLSRSESQQTSSDELSDAVAQQNGRNMMLGMTASAGVNFGVAQASTSVSLGMSAMQMTAQMTAHKQMRGQSEQIAKEIRASRKTTFRTSVEVEDTSSRRYVMSNGTNELINYELRRKMRRVGVQVQHVGTQLCWQTYVKAPGALLRRSRLIHVAGPTESELGLEPPQPPEALKIRSTEDIREFQFLSVTGHGLNDGLYTSAPGRTIGSYVADPSHDAIISEMTYAAEPPAAGYVLDEVTLESVEGTDPQRDPPKVNLGPEIEVIDDNSYRLHLLSVDFRSQPAIRFHLRLIWRPTSDATTGAEAAYLKKVAEYDEQKDRAYKAALTNALRDRIAATRSVAPRPAADLRGEERSVVYQALLSELTGFRADRTDEQVHVTSELIRALFDIDSMLYFVAPDWWKPRDQPDGMVSTQASTLPRYPVTELSQPAPFGASLGWRMQVDGDLHRNAFLNTPWIKAVIPIQPGREMAALKWLEAAEVEGNQGLDLPYTGPEPELAGLSIKDALLRLADQVRADNTRADVVGQTEKVFTSGFDPLQGGFRFSPTAQGFQIFDQWLEILPTDQVAAVVYKPDGG